MMDKDTEAFCQIAGRLMRCPAATYHESRVAAEVRAICAEQELAVEEDAFGNLIVRLASAPDLRPIVLSAHMDHPAFEIRKRVADRAWQAEFLGGVPEAYFREGVSLLLQPGGHKARLGKKLVGPKKSKRYEITADSPVAVPPEFAVWDLKEFAVRNERIHGRVCDDLIGVAAILHTLIGLKRRKAKVHVVGLITRAEEVGFQGALAAAAHGTVPSGALVISLETSSRRPPVKMGEGVIVRVGDRSSVFDSTATRFLTETAEALRKRDPSFKYQRALMSGGSCEGTAFAEYGFQTAAVCVALGNYHNCGPKDTLREEFIGLPDATGMARLLVAAALAMPRYDAFTGKLRLRLAKLQKEGERRLRRK